MKIWTSNYVLNSPWHGPGHAGCLLKVELDDGSVGYADLHPWPELGDPDLAFSLRALINNQPILPIVMQATRLAVEDAQARKSGRSIILGHTMPLSHRLIPDLMTATLTELNELLAENFTHIKVKLGKNLAVETEQLKKLIKATAFKWRLDFNARLSAAQFRDWFESVRDWLEPSLDGMEDPVQEGEDLVMEGPFFADRTERRKHWGIVWKPEILPQPKREPLQRMWATNNLGHPFGHAVAAVMAARSGLAEVHGLQGLEHYERSQWTESLRYYGPVTTPLAGTGFGGDELLERMTWKKLS